MALDLLVFAAHPDDAELAAGGLIARAVRDGYRVGVVDMTRGEMGTRGTPETRRAEAEAASRILGLAVRENLGLPDGELEPTLAARRMVVEAIRRHRPHLLAAPYVEDLHPDHAAAGRLVDQALYPSGFARYETGSPPYRAGGLIHYMNHTRFQPTFILDITEVWDVRMEALRSFGSQFHQPGSTEPATNISSPEFLERLEARYRHFGSIIGVGYGEPYWTRRPPPILDPVAAFRGRAARITEGGGFPEVDAGGPR